MRQLIPMRVAYLVALFSLFGCGSDSRGSAEADAAVDADAGTPTCTITAPSTGTATGFDVAVTLVATATDPQDGALSAASVVWRTDLQTAPLGNGTTLMTTLPVGTNVVTCTATDSSGKTGTATVTVISKSPYAKINHPSDGEMRPASQDVPFVGIGRDVEDGNLAGGSLVWTSNLDGALNTGTMFNRQLSVGTHTITLTVTDAGGNTDATSISLIMQ